MENFADSENLLFRKGLVQGRCNFAPKGKASSKKVFSVEGNTVSQ
jgi:hypothetical protein